MNMRLKVLKKHLLFCCSEHCNHQEVEDVMQVFKEHLVGGEPVDELVMLKMEA